MGIARVREVKEPDLGEVQGLLAALHASPEFARAPVMRRLLDYLVAETLAGRGAQVKGYAVAVEGLGRDASFDPQTDSYPRVQVGRLRRMLDAHFARSDPGALVISVPSGGYRVQFSRVEREDQEPVTDTPRTPPSRRLLIAGGAALVVLCAAVVGVLLFVLSPRTTPAASAQQLVRAPTLAVVPASHPGDPTRADRRLDDVDRRVAAAISRTPIATLTGRDAAARADYVLALSTDAMGTELTLDLSHRRSTQQLWSDRLPMPRADADIERELLPRVATVVRPFGIIATHQRAHLGGSYAPGYPCLLRFAEYFRDRSAEMVRPVAECVDRTLALDPGDAEALAAASSLQFDWSLTHGSAESRARGTALARRAVQANPYSARALVADARVAMIAGNCVRGDALIQRAIALDPYDPNVLALSGLLLAGCDLDRGGALLDQARALEPDLASFYAALRVFIAAEQRGPAEADAIARAMRPPGRGTQAQYHLGRMFADAVAGRREAARTEWQRAVALSAKPRDTADEVLRQYYYAGSLRARMEAALARWGVETRSAGREGGSA